MRAALLHRAGDYGSMLSLIEHLELASEGPLLARMLHELQLSPAELYAIQLDAFDWVNDYAHGVQ